MPAEFMKSKGVGYSPYLDEKGPIDDLAKHVNEFAAVDWDRFCAENGIELEDSVRFVCCGDTWRAFTGEAQKKRTVTDEHGVERVWDGFLGEWFPSTMQDPKSGLYVPSGSWKRERTVTTKKVELRPSLRARVEDGPEYAGQLPVFMGGDK